MAYIGNTGTTQTFTPAIDYFSGNGSTTAFTLSRPVTSVAQIQVTINNVAQNPSSAYTVSGSTLTFTSAPLSGSSNIYVYYTSPNTQVIAPSQGTVGTAQLTSDLQNANYGFKNRIINGAMVIDQRNAGASVTPNNSYTLDRWQGSNSQTAKYTVQQSSTSTTGFINSLLATSSSAYTVGASDIFALQQKIEGLNCADLAWGTANAATVTLSFWVRSSLTGTFGGSLQNNANNRSYPFSYTISSANTFEQKTITIAGDTTGTWLTTSGTGIIVTLSIGAGATVSGTAGAWAGSTYYSATGATSVVGTNGATFYITGVQLEKGSTATSFDYRPYGTELQLAQRYFEATYPIGTALGTASSETLAPTAYSMGDSGVVTQQIIWSYKVKKRSAPTVTIYNPNTGATGSGRFSTLNINFSVNAARVDQATLGSGTAGMTTNAVFSYFLTADSEL